MKLTINGVLGSVFLVIFLAACGGGGGSSEVGSAGSSSLGGSDGGGEIVDNGSPYVLSTNPVNSSAAVKTNRDITVTFNESIEPATITLNSFLLDNDDNGDIVAGTIAYDSNSRIATFRTEDFSPETTYVATITTDVEDLAGNALSQDYTWQFTTGSASAPDTIDTTSPLVQSRFPAPTAVSVPPNAVISATFDEPIDPFTINTNTVTLSDGINSVPGSVSYVGTTILFEPDTDLTVDTDYTVSIAETVTDLAGNPLGTAEEWNFTTGNQADVQSPQVLSVSPPDGAIDVTTDSSLVVTFDEAVKPFEFGVIDGRPVTATFNESYTGVTMEPTAGLHPGVTYNASVRVSDKAGNLMDEVFRWEFKTAL